MSLSPLFFYSFSFTCTSTVHFSTSCPHPSPPSLFTSCISSSVYFPRHVFPPCVFPLQTFPLSMHFPHPCIPPLSLIRYSATNFCKILNRFKLKLSRREKKDSPTSTGVELGFNWNWNNSCTHVSFNRLTSIAACLLVRDVSHGS